MLTRYLRLLALAVLAIALPVAAHHVDDTGCRAGRARQANRPARRRVPAGIVDWIVVDESGDGTHRIFPILRRPTAAASRCAADAIQASSPGRRRPSPRATPTGVSFTGARSSRRPPDARGSPAARCASRAAASRPRRQLRRHASEFIFQSCSTTAALPARRAGDAAGVLENGMRVSVDGNIAAAGEMAADRIDNPGAGAVPKPRPPPSSTAAPVTTNYLVLPIKFPTSAAAPWVYNADPFTPATLNTRGLRALPTKSVKEYYKEASYGQQLLSGIVADNGSGGFLRPPSRSRPPATSA